MSGFLTVSIGSGLNGTIYGDCQVPLKAFLESRGEAFQRESLLPYLYRMEKSRHGRLRARGRRRRLSQDRL